MKKLAYWSHQNPIKARMIIAFCHILLLTIAISFGIGMYLEDYRIPTGLSFLMAGIFYLAYVYYPKKGCKDGPYKYSWIRRVRHDLVLISTSTIIVASGVNQFAFQPTAIQGPLPPVSLMVIRPDAEHPVMTKKEIRQGFIRQIREYKAELRHELKVMKAERKDTDQGQAELKFFLILLVIAAAIAAFYGIGVLACGLSCGGQEGAAAAVVLGGIAGIFLLGFLAIRGIVRIGRNR